MVVALSYRNLPEGATLDPTVCRMRLQFFAIACSLLRTLVTLVVLGVVLMCSVPMYHAVGVCVCYGVVRLYWLWMMLLYI